MKKLKTSDIAVVGLGNWGSSLAAAVVEAGMPLREVVGRGRKIRSRYAVVAWDKAVFDAGIVWLCVPDSAIAAVTEQIAHRRGDMRGQIVVHSSGALSVDVLKAALAAGAEVASIHPVMSFPTRRAVPLGGVLFGVETRAVATRRRLYGVIRGLGGKPFPIVSGDKALYHAAGTLASPLLVSLLTAAIETARLAGLDRKTAAHWVRALAQATAENVFERGSEQSFSGPFARGDAMTIHLHLQALVKHPILTGVYRSLAAHALQALPVKNPESLRQALRDAAPEKLNPPAGKPARRAIRVRN